MSYRFPKFPNRLYVVAVLAAGVLFVACRAVVSVGNGDEGDNVNNTLAVFTDPDTGFSTVDVRDIDEDIVQFDTEVGTLIWTATGVTFEGWQVDGNFLLTSNTQFQVRFGTKDGERRAYFTEVDPPTVCDLLLAQGELQILPTVFFVPQGEMSTKASGNGVYVLNGLGGMQGMFMFDLQTGNFICAAGGGGETVGSEGNFLMIITGCPPIDRVRFDTVQINGSAKNRVQFTGRGLTVTVNNDFAGLPGDQDEVEVLIDELVECTFVVEVVDDDEGGDRWRTTIYDAEIWPDGTQFKNFEGDDIATAVVIPLVSGDITIGEP